MMAANSIASLAVKLSADASDFDKELGRAESRLNGFAAKITSPLNLGRGLGQSLTESIGNPLQAIMTDVGRFTALLPGLSVFGEAIAHPVREAEKAMGRLRDLAREAETVGVGPQFYRSIQLAAGAESETMEKALVRLARLKGEV